MILAGLALGAVAQAKSLGQRAKLFHLQNLTVDPSSRKAGAGALALSQDKGKGRRAAKARVVVAAPLLLRQPVERLGNNHKVLPGAAKPLQGRFQTMNSENKKTAGFAAGP